MASPGHGQTGLNLSWDDCGTFGANAKAFACNTNEGSNTLVASFAVEPEHCLTAHSAVLDLQTSGATLPSWWQFRNAGSCRQTALSASADFTSGPASCQELWLDQGTAGVSAYQAGFGAPNRARIIVFVSTSAPECLPAPAGVEMYAFKLLISNAMSVGAGSCAGCDDGVCIVFNSLRLIQHPGLPRPVITTPLDRNFVTWQAGIPDCPGATPARNRTWGAIKTLYR